MSRVSARLVFGLTLAFFAAFFLWPVLEILKGGFIDADGRLTFGTLFALLADPVYLTGLRNSFLLATAATALALALAVPLAVAADRFRFPGRGLFSALVLVPLILPPTVTALTLNVGSGITQD